MAKNPADVLRADALRICEALEARYGRRKFGPFVDFIEAMIYQILDLGASEKAAKDAQKRLHDEYTDWNDMRVATVRDIEDVLGSKYPQVREKAEDIRHLLADIYTAFRVMDIKEHLNQDGIATLRALPDTTNIRRDMIERSLMAITETTVCPLDEDQVRLLKFLTSATKALGPALKPLPQTGCAKKLEECCDAEIFHRLCRGLREHIHFCQGEGEDEPQIIGFGWDQKDPLGMGKPVKKDKPAPVAKPKDKDKPKDKPTAPAKKKA
jgi:hypothetical protein